MNNKFSTFTPNNNTKSECNNSNNIDESKIEDMYNKYKDLSAEELMNEFIKLSTSKKSNGTLNNSDIDMYRKAIYPYLTDEQKTTFEKLMNVVK